MSKNGSRATAINGRGDVAGYEGVLPTLWLRKGGKRSIELPDGSQDGVVSAIAQDQTVVGTYSPYQTNNNQHCFIAYPSGPLQDLGLVGTGQVCGASDVNGSHQVVGTLSTTTDGGKLQAFVWQDGQFHLLGILPGGDFSVAHSINSRGDIVGRSTRGGSPWTHGVLWRDGAMIDIGQLRGAFSHSVTGGANHAAYLRPSGGNHCRRAFMRRAADRRRCGVRA